MRHAWRQWREQSVSRYVFSIFAKDDPGIILAYARFAQPHTVRISTLLPSCADNADPLKCIQKATSDKTQKHLYFFNGQILNIGGYARRRSVKEPADI
jgi:hypothetical protein